MSGEASRSSSVDIGDYKAVMAVSKAKNWTEAAFDTFQSASTISKRISRVEATLGLRIFERGTKSVHTEFSSVGRSVMPYIDNIVDTYDQILLLSDRIKKATGDELNIGYGALFGTAGETEIISAFRMNFPEMGINQVIRNRETLTEMVSRGELDCAFIFWIGGLSDENELSRSIYGLGLSYFPVFFQDKKYVGLSKKHPHANDAEVKLTDLQNEIFIFNRTLEDSQNTMGIFRYLIPDEDGENIKNVKQMDFMNRQLVYKYVASGRAIIPIATIPPREETDDVVFVPIERLRSPVFTVLVYNKNNPNLNVRKFVEFSREYSKEAKLI